MSTEIPSKYFVTVDVVLFTMDDDHPSVLLVTRSNPPFAGTRALPGGFVEADEALAAAAVRELEEETGLRLPVEALRQLGTYGDPGRDPRGRTITVVYVARAVGSLIPRSGSDAAAAEFVAIEGLTPGDLAFDHHRILLDAVQALDLGPR